jgi:hypothetical protein
VVLAVALLVVAAWVAVAVTAMLLVRRRMPAGGLFKDTNRAAGIFNVMGTGYAVLIGFVIFLAFGSYQRAGDGASREAVGVNQMFTSAALFPSPVRPLQAQLVCYGRAVVHLEWPAMRSARASPVVNLWARALDTTVDRISATDVRAEAPYAHLLDESSERIDGRRARLAEAMPYVPAPVWLFLIAGASLLVVYMLFNADPAERWLSQAFTMGAIAASVVSGMVIVWLLDHPYERVSGSIRPTAMRASLAEMEPAAARRRIALPCDARGA